MNIDVECRSKYAHSNSIFKLTLGKRCEYLTSLSFLHNSSHVEMEPLNVRPQANVTIPFATEQQNGVILYTGDRQHLVIDIPIKSSISRFKIVHHSCH